MKTLISRRCSYLYVHASLVFFLSLIFLIIDSNLSATAQFNLTIPSMQTAQELLPHAFANYTRKNYDSAVIYLNQILAVRPAISPLLASFVNYHLGVNYCLSGKKEQALSALEAAVGGGFAESDELLRNTDLISLHRLSRFDSILMRAERNASALKLYDITLWNNKGLGFSYLYSFDSWSNGKMIKLREKYHLDTLRKPDDTELDVQIRILNWTHNRWKHNPLNIASNQDADVILDSVAVGASYRCAEYAAVLTQALQAMGYPARVVELHSKGVSYGIAKAHVAVEVWNNELMKWVFLDPQNNAAWKHGNTLLNADEIRELILDNHLDSLEMYVFPSTWLRKETIFPSEWLKYFYYLFYRFENQFAERPELMQSFAPLCYLRDNQTPELLYQGIPRALVTTSNSLKVYPTMNLVHADIAAVSIDTPFIDLVLNTTMPSFNYFEIKANGITTKQLHKDFRWAITHGKNSIVVKAVNQAGVKGPPMLIELEYVK